MCVRASPGRPPTVVLFFVCELWINSVARFHVFTVRQYIWDILPRGSDREVLHTDGSPAENELSSVFVVNIGFNCFCSRITSVIVSCGQYYVDMHSTVILIYVVVTEEFWTVCVV